MTKLYFLSSVFALCIGSVSEAQVSQRALASQLTSSDVSTRRQGLSGVQKIHPSRMGQELRSALILALSQENKARAQRAMDDLAGKPIPELEDPGFYLAIVSSVVRLEDQSAIPALVGALGTGAKVPRALARFGEVAAMPVIDAVRSPNASHNLIQGGLIALRMMVEQSEQRPLSTVLIGHIREVAKTHLEKSHRFASTTRWAIDLAAVLTDPQLHAQLGMIATDTAYVQSLGITDSWEIGQTQRRARDRLAGIPPVPRPLHF